MRVGKRDRIVAVGINGLKHVVVSLDTARDVVYARQVGVSDGIQVRGQGQRIREVLVEPVPLLKHLRRPLVVADLGELVRPDLR